MGNPEPGAWRKSTYSMGSGDCVEVAWRKAAGSFSNGQCAGAGRGTCGMVHVRDSKDPDGPVLTFASPEWDAFVQGVRAGEFGLR